MPKDELDEMFSGQATGRFRKKIRMTKTGMECWLEVLYLINELNRLEHELKKKEKHIAKLESELAFRS